MAKAQAEAKQREEEAKRHQAELEAAIEAAKLKSEIGTKAGVDARQEAEVYASELAQLRNLEIENGTLKRMLSEAYQEIAMLKNRYQH